MDRKPIFSDRESIARYITENGIRILNLCHVPEDGRLKTLSFSTNDKGRVDDVLEHGERVDGSSLFSFIEPGRSDIYIMPKAERSFVNPFATLPTLNVLCDYLDEDGKPLTVAPQNVLNRAEERLRSRSGITLNSLAELEFYIFTQQQTGILFRENPDRNYHESAPFASFENVRNEMLATMEIVGVATKYGHSEVGWRLDDNGTLMEQHEIELAPKGLEEMASSIAVAKWVIRNVCARHGLGVSFIPKVDLEHAGTGMHVHLCGMRNGKNITADADGKLSGEALEMIGGILTFAQSLSAFANPTPVSYLRFISRKESPMHVCWSARNRLALIRVPLWWSFRREAKEEEDCRETFEYRAPDAFANAHLLLAGVALAAEYGLGEPKKSAKTAEKLHAEHATGEKEFETLPVSCVEAAEFLERDRRFYETDGVFPEKLVDKTVEKLKAYKDRDLWKNLLSKETAMRNAIDQFLHWG